tara:strand:- start:267 stop:584 length:318 start_codon:yes stop_codon:yes gene_type:complete
MKTTALILALGLSVFVTGCGPSKAEREAAERQRLELEEQARRETEAANKAITEMNQSMFKKLTPEERAARDAERKRKAQQLVDDWKEKEAQQEAPKSSTEPASQP